ncbi:MAG: MBL fold metallo-hydrolase, partial [Bacteroidota bacterium]
VYYTGFCTASKSIAIKGGKGGEIKFHANAVLIQHPEKGNMLFDTGYAPRFYELTSKWPEKIQALSTPTTTQASWAMVEQLKAEGIEAKDIPYLIISHFHADHIAGLEDFPHSQIYANQSAYAQIKKYKGFAAVRRGLIPTFLPDDIGERINFFEGMKLEERSDEFGFHYDFFGDGSIRVVQIPGHARGQIGLILNEDHEASIFLAADGYWLTEALEKNALPRSIVKLFFDDWKAYKESFEKIRLYRERHPNCKMINCHCPQVFEETEAKIYR